MNSKTTAGQYHERLTNELNSQTALADGTVALIERLKRAVRADMEVNGGLSDAEAIVLRAAFVDLEDSVTVRRARADSAKLSLDRISMSRHNSKLATGMDFLASKAVAGLAGVITTHVGADDFAALAREASAEMDDPTWSEDIGR